MARPSASKANHGSKTKAKAKAKQTHKQDPLPVTILSGFLGAGKTSLLRHILESNQHKLKIAVIVNDMAELNIDASLIETSGFLQTKQEIVSMQNGCICCTLRADLIHEINKLKDCGTFDYVLIESTGIAEPQQVAESFCFDADTAQLAEDPAKMLWNVARLDTCVTVVDAHHFPKLLKSLKAFKEEFPVEVSEDDKQEGEKNIGQLLVEQVEFADVIILNKTDLVNRDERDAVANLIVSLNPTAKIIDAVHGKIDLALVLNTKLFDLDKAKSSPGWMLSLTQPHFKGEADEYGVSSFVYTARKPFHPARLHQWIESNMYHARTWEQRNSTKEIKRLRLLKDSDSDNDTRMQFMTANYGSILRSKGYCWIAGRDGVMGEWAQAGRLLAITPMMQWFADTPEEEWEMVEVDAKEEVKKKFVPVYGDRRQEIVFIGIHLKQADIVKALDNCLLTDHQMQCHLLTQSEGTYYDPLPAWIIHYNEPCPFTCILRCGQEFQFVVEAGSELIVQNVCLNTSDDDTVSSVKVWLDSRAGKKSTLICTFRPGTCEQHSLALTLPAAGDDDNHYTLRMEQQEMAMQKHDNDNDGRQVTKRAKYEDLEEGSSYTGCEVHLAGLVFKTQEEDHDEHDDHDDGVCDMPNLKKQ